jgi:hypothetical protein
MSSWEGMVGHYVISVNMFVRKNKWRLILAGTDLRKRARHLENELDQKLVTFSKLRVQQEYARGLTAISATFLVIIEQLVLCFWF